MTFWVYGLMNESIFSRFYLGGPTSVRGFGMYSIGPQSEGTKHYSSINEFFSFLNQLYLNQSSLSKRMGQSTWGLLSKTIRQRQTS